MSFSESSILFGLPKKYHIEHVKVNKIRNIKHAIQKSSIPLRGSKKSQKITVRKRLRHTSIIEKTKNRFFCLANLLEASLNFLFQPGK